MTLLVGQPTPILKRHFWSSLETLSSITKEIRVLAWQVGLFVINRVHTERIFDDGVVSSTRLLALWKDELAGVIATKRATAKRRDTMVDFDTRWDWIRLKL